MSLKLVAVLLSIAGISGVAIGYYLRLIISLGKKGSMELEIKEMLLTAKEEAKRITNEADSKSKKFLEEAHIEIKSKEEKVQQMETRLIKKEDLLDRRQTDIDKEVELIKERVAEIKVIREKSDKLEQERAQALERVANMSTEEARQTLIKTVERNSEQDLLTRIRKFEQSGGEILNKKAQDINISNLCTQLPLLCSAVEFQTKS